jgi:hypothetical protein
MEKTEIDLAIQKLHESTLEPEWMREMGAHYRRTGTFRPEDLRRVLGDPTKGVMISREDDVLGFVRG